MNITEPWLKANNFKLKKEDDHFWHRERRLTNQTLIELSPSATSTSEQPKFHCWLIQDDPRRHIHIRYMTDTDDLIALCEALSGKPWDYSEVELDDSIAEVEAIRQAMA